jgi:bacterioferritin-associated ferredoxin
VRASTRPAILDSFQFALAISLELLQIPDFPFASPRGVQYLIGKHHRPGSPPRMIVCSCNILSDHDVRNAVTASTDLPRNAKQIYGCLGCSAECGRCARTIKSIIDEALGACAKSCCAGCPHSHQAAEESTQTEPAQTEFALAAC